MNGKSARGMPNVDLSIQSQERIEQENTPIPESEMFKKKGENVSMEVKETEKKPKKKLTEKQLEALKRGREKSMETRKAKAQKKKAEDKEWANRREAEEKRLAPPPPVVKEESSFVDTRQQYSAPPPMPQAPSMGNFSIDYDKIIHGVSSQLDQRRLQREQKEHEVADNIAKYEEQIREDERNKLYAELDAEEEEEKQRKNAKTTQKVLQTHRPVDYSYAFQGGRSRYRRY